MPFFSLYFRSFILLFGSVKSIVRHIGRPHSTQTAPMAVSMGSKRAQIVRKSSPTGRDVSPSVLVEPCAATCASRGMARPC